MTLLIQGFLSNYHHIELAEKTAEALVQTKYYEWSKFPAPNVTKPESMTATHVPWKSL